MSHSFADILSSEISNTPEIGFVPATEVKPGQYIRCRVDNGRSMRESVLEIKSVTVTPSGMFVHYDVGSDEEVEVYPSQFIRVL